MHRETVGLTDLDSDVRAGEAAEHLLVGDVVADEHGGTGANLMTQRVQCVSLVGGHHRQFDDLLPLGDGDTLPLARPLPDSFERVAGFLGGGTPYVYRHAGRLHLE